MPSVMLIDADIAHLAEAATALQQRGASVQTFADGNEALSTLRGSRPDLIVLCVELGRLSGYSICNKLKKDPLLSVVPLVLTSAHASKETFEQHRRLKTHAEAYLTKPYSTAALCQVAAKFVALSPAPAGVAEAAPPQAAAAAPQVSLPDEQTRPTEVPWGTQSSFDIALTELHHPAPADAPADAPEETLLETHAFEDAEVPADAEGGEPPSGDRLAAALEAALPDDAPAAAAPLPFAGGEATQTSVSLPPFAMPGDGTGSSDAAWALRARLAELEQAQAARELAFNEQLASLSNQARDAATLRQHVDMLSRDKDRLQGALGRISAAEQEARSRCDALHEQLEAHLARDRDQARQVDETGETERAAQRQNELLHAQIAELQQQQAQLAQQVQGLTVGGQKARKAVDVAALLIDELAANP